MAFKQLIKTLTKPSLLLFITGLIVIGLCFGVANTLKPSTSSGAQYWFLTAIAFAIAVLFVLVLINLLYLYRQYRQQVIGSKLSVRLVSLFILLTVMPLLLIYIFSAQVLNKGVNTWFDVKVEQAVNDALILGKSSLETIKQDVIDEMRIYSREIADVSSSAELVSKLYDIRLRSGFSEISVFTDNGRVIANSSERVGLIPDLADETTLSRLKFGQTYSSVEPVSETSQQLRVITPIPSKNINLSKRALQAIKPLPLRYANLAKSVEQAKSQYDQMRFSREPLRWNLLFILTLIALAAVLLSCLAAFYASRRLVAPLGALASGTREVAGGNYDMELPVQGNDEMGILVSSFNDMTRQIKHAKAQQSRSQTEVESQREHLEAVLANLSSGVIYIDENTIVGTTNARAEAILNFPLSQHIGEPLQTISSNNEAVAPFLEAIILASSRDVKTWQDERTILGESGRKTLIVRGSRLPHHKDSSVIVFDDITDLIQAQKDAAWGEVARRLAHEIKNPLTPIQLSAERILRKFGSQLQGEQKKILENSTKTIIQQVDAMKEMVNAFASYAQTVHAEKKPVNLNKLVREVAELHLHSSEKCQLELSLNASIPTIVSNPNALRQVFTNLIINALHAIDEVKSPKIEIIADFHQESENEYIKIMIVDNGVGIPSNIEGSLFEPYVSSKSSGTGLGLAIVKRITEELGGNVLAKRLEIGSCFTVILPTY